MLDNSSPFLEETEELRTVAVCRLLKAPERAAALAAAIDVASTREVRVIAVELLGLIEQNPITKPPALQRKVQTIAGAILGRSVEGLAQDLAVSALGARWSDLSPELRGRAIAAGRNLLARWATDASRREAAGKVAAAHVIADLGDPSLASTVSPMLLDPNAMEAADAAVEALLALAGVVSGTETKDLHEWAWDFAVPSSGDRPPAPTSQMRRDLHSRVAGLATGFMQHRKQGVLRAAMVLMDAPALAFAGQTPRDPLVRWFLDSGHESHMALRGVLKRSSGAVARQRAWEWMGRDIAESACSERLSRPATIPEHEAVLRRAHLRLSPARARRMNQMRVSQTSRLRGIPMLPSMRQLRSLAPEVRRTVPGMAATLPLSDQMRAEVLRPLMTDGDPTVRFAALADGPEQHAGLFCRDADVRIATMAAVRVFVARESGRESGGPTDLEMLTSSVHEPVREIGSSMIDASDPWASLQGASERSRLAARRMMQEDRGGFLRSLRGRIERGEVAERIGAIMLARGLGLVPEIELELLRITAALVRRDEDDRLGATAVAALGELARPASVAALRACTLHGDSRVRANAVEALLRTVQRGRGLPAEVLELKQDSCHRVRANILRVLLQLPAERASGARFAAAELTFMLADARPLHRLAGLWALERAVIGGARGAEVQRRWNDLATRLAELTREEPEAPVRARAARCARLMLRHMEHRRNEDRLASAGQAKPGRGSEVAA